MAKEAFDLVFLKARIVILCKDGFEIMDLDEYVARVLQAPELF